MATGIGPFEPNTSNDLPELPSDMAVPDNTPLPYIERRSTQPMQDQLNTLNSRVSTVEQLQKDHMAQTAQTVQNTQELLDAFAAAKGAWKVLNFIGKGAGPVLTLMTIVGTIAIWWHDMKGWFK